MDNMAIKQHPFWVRPYMVPHFCGTSTCVGRFEESKSRGRGHHGRTGAALDLVATLTGSSDNLSKMQGLSDRALTELGPVTLGKSGPRHFSQVFYFPEKHFAIVSEFFLVKLRHCSEMVGLRCIHIESTRPLDNMFYSYTFLSSSLYLLF